MDFLELAESRYTTKKYNSQKKISKEKIQQLKAILRLSPSSINSQPWNFIFISDEAMKQKLASVSYFNEQKINEASHLVVFNAINNIVRFEEQIRENLPEVAVNYYDQNIRSGSDDEIRSWLQKQVYISLGFFLSACASLDIDSTPLEGIHNEQYQEILKLQDYKTLFAVALGYRDPEDANQPSVKSKSRLPLEQIIQSI